MTHINYKFKILINQINEEIRNVTNKTQKSLFLFYNFQLIKLFLRLRYQFICIHNLARRWS